MIIVQPYHDDLPVFRDELREPVYPITAENQAPQVWQARHLIWNLGQTLIHQSEFIDRPWGTQCVGQGVAHGGRIRNPKMARPKTHRDEASEHDEDR
jgi:hypothetical protein